MAKGTYTAFQQLKPAELKSASFFSSFADDFIKRGDADRAAALKKAQDEGKSLADVLKEYKIEHAITAAPFQDESNRIANEAIDKLATAKMMAEDMRIPIEQRRRYAQEAMDLTNSVKEFYTYAADPKLAEQMLKNSQMIADGKAFEGDERIGLYTSMESGLWKTRWNGGKIEVAYVKDVNEPNPELTWEPFSNVKSKFMSPVQEDVLEKYNKNLVEIAQKVTTETTNSNGYLETYSKKFDAKDARSFLMTTFGFDPSKPAQENYNVNNVPAELNQLFYQKNKRNITSAEDLNTAIDDSVEIMRTTADEKTTRKVLRTAEQIEKDRLDIIKARQDIANNGRSNSGNSNSKPPTYSFIEGATITRKYGTSGTADLNNAVIIDLKGKQQIAGFKVPNKSGKGTHIEYAIIGRDKYGRQAMEKVTSWSDAQGRILANGIDPRVFEEKVKASPEIQTVNIRRNNDIGTIKYGGALVDKEDDEDDKR